MARTLRLLMPQWQGGNNPAYALGAKLLAMIAPGSEKALLAKVPVEPFEGNPLPVEDGVVARSILRRQLASATRIIEQHQPDRIIVFGGDCLVAQAPFMYLNQKYEGGLGVLWLDAHPDISVPGMHGHEHAMVLGNLMGYGDPVFAAEVKAPVRPERVMYGGLREMTPREAEIVRKLGLRWAGPEALAQDSAPVLAWIEEMRIRHLAVHFDLDVLDPKGFRSLLFAEPGGPVIHASSGTMTLAQIARVIRDVSQKTDVVGLSVAEYLPWDEINLRNAFDAMPIFHQ